MIRSPGHRRLEASCLGASSSLSIIGLLACAALFGCRAAAVAPGPSDPDRETGERITAAAASDPVERPLPVLAGTLDEKVRRCVDRICSPRFRVRALAQQALLALGTDTLALLARAHDEAPAGSRKQNTLEFLIERIQRQRSPEAIVREMAEATGVRQRAAVRAAARLGMDAVPSLLALLTHREPGVRKNVIIVLRTITARHPSLTGHGPVHAIRVWREWYQEALKKRAKSRPKDRFDPTPLPGPVVPEVTVTVSL